ncbi:hypothetical protein QO034_03880 [Sedimentitalea sp. JM2-8]|uniref:Uncharacterized protein n=1 Tax=Sedimentitalea xiamensis TaxID=3050037 RepID=A0ABT7FAX8_9RHOB|nr:hypothetical protein [Sedimentitalea xiamensis]MDK3072240.1 hypothetical protein [Sedimentitalea xiamensis]
MTGPVTVPANETGKLRLFALDMPAEQARALRDSGGIDGLLGVLQVDPAYVEIFLVKDLDGLGITGYLTEGCGIPQEQVAQDRTHLQALTGYVVLVFSRAFGGREVTLHPAAELELIATYSERPVDWSATPIPTDSARKRAGSPQSPRDRRSHARRIGGGIFAIFMVLIAAGLYLVLR